MTYLSVCHGTCLAQTVCLVDFDVESLVHRIHQFFGQRRSAARDYLHRRQVILVHHLISRQTYDDRRCDINERDLVLLDRLQKCLHIKRRHDHKLDSTMQHLMYQSSQTIDMKKRQHTQKLVCSR